MLCTPKSCGEYSGALILSCKEDGRTPSRSSVTLAFYIVYMSGLYFAHLIRESLVRQIETDKRTLKTDLNLQSYTNNLSTASHVS